MKTKKPCSEKQYRVHARTRMQSRTKIFTADPVVEPVTSQLMANLGLQILSVQEEVQQRIASDLHDSTCQHLIAASLGVMRLKRTKNLEDATDRICDDIDASINLALQEIRTLTYLLHPQNLLSDGLKVTIERYVEGFSRRASLKSHVAIAEEVDRLSYSAQGSLLRVIQEALANVFRHAKATRVRVTIEATGTHLHLRVSDDGRGAAFNQAESAAGVISFGVGIPGMKIRLNQLGGTLEIRSSSAAGCRGTTLSAAIPYVRGRTRVPERRQAVAGFSAKPH